MKYSGYTWRNVRLRLIKISRFSRRAQALCERSFPFPSFFKTALIIRSSAISKNSVERWYVNIDNRVRQVLLAASINAHTTWCLARSETQCRIREDIHRKERSSLCECAKPRRESSARKKQRCSRRTIRRVQSSKVRSQASDTAGVQALIREYGNL